MTEGLKYFTFNTDMGWIGVLSSARELRRTTLPQPSAPEARQILGESQATWAPSLFDSLVQRFRTTSVVAGQPFLTGLTYPGLPSFNAKRGK